MSLIAIVYIVLVKLYLTAAFQIRCPVPLERHFRSMALCADASNYTCLFDEDQMSYNESCSIKFDFQRPGYRVTFRTNLNGISCPPDLYQPLVFLSNESSNCELKKSFCRNEGQLLSWNGTNKMDRQCRCNHVEGYTFVGNPKDACSCIPTEDDCSCYRKQCSKNSIIPPDYQCIDKFTSSENFTCSLIPDLPQDIITVVYKIQVSNVTVSSNNTYTNNIHRGVERKEKVAFRILLCLITFVIMLSVIFSSIAIIKNDNSTGFGNNKMIITEQVERDNKTELPAETNIITKAIEKLDATNFVLLWGKPGCGKTRTLCKIAEYYQTSLGYRLITCHKPSDIFAQECVTEKIIFVIDDIFGRFVFSHEKVLILKKLGKRIQQFIKENPVKLIMTCSSVAFRNDCLQELDLFTNNTFELPETSLIDNKNMDSGEILGMVEHNRNSNYEAYCSLFILILKQGCIHESDLTSDDDNMLNKLIGNVCYQLNIEVSGQWFTKNLNSLMGTFIKKENMLFAITQTSVFEVLAVYFGQELQPLLLQFADPDLITQHCCFTSCSDLDRNGTFRIQVDKENEELYFLRIKDKLQRKDLTEVFSVPQMKSASYRKKFDVFLKNLEPDLLKEINNSTCRLRTDYDATALILTSRYVNISKIFIEAKNLN